jgi:hypothetical protein
LRPGIAAVGSLKQVFFHVSGSSTSGVPVGRRGTRRHLSPSVVGKVSPLQVSARLEAQ